MDRTVDDLVKAAKQRIENLDADAVEKEMAQGAIIVDLREPAELEANGRVPGAMHIPRGMLEWRADTSSTYHQPPLDPDARVVLFCAGGGRSALAAVALQDMGYKSVAHLESGFGGWKDAGKPIES